MARSYANPGNPQPSAAEALVERVLEEGLGPDLQIFYQSLLAQTRVFPLRPNQLRRLLDKMLESGLPTDAVAEHDEEGAEGEAGVGEEGEPLDEGPLSGAFVYGMTLHWLAKAEGNGSGSGNRMCSLLLGGLAKMRKCGVPPDLQVCHAVMQCLAHAKPSHPETAERIISEYMQPQKGGCAPDADTFALLAKAYANAYASPYANAHPSKQDPGAAQETLARLAVAGLRPGTKNINAVLESFARAVPPRIEELEGEPAGWGGAFVGRGGAFVGQQSRVSSRGGVVGGWRSCAALLLAQEQGAELLLSAESYNWLIHALANAKPEPLPGRAAAVLDRMCVPCRGATWR
eukprot:SAG31_NODE_11082_length_1068_cov_1.211558_1_plen_345_part_10